jgi:hypothetical protein
VRHGSSEHVIASAWAGSSVNPWSVRAIPTAASARCAPSSDVSAWAYVRAASLDGERRRLDAAEHGDEIHERHQEHEGHAHELDDGAARVPVPA